MTNPQRTMLQRLAAGDEFYQARQWVRSAHTVLNALVTRGFAEVPVNGMGVGTVRITDAGRAALSES